MPDERIARRVFETGTIKEMRRGRPRKKWMDVVRKNLGEEWGQRYQLASDRKTWKSLCKR